MDCRCQIFSHLFFFSNYTDVPKHFRNCEETSQKNSTNKNNKNTSNIIQSQFTCLSTCFVILKGNHGHITFLTQTLLEEKEGCSPRTLLHLFSLSTIFSSLKRVFQFPGAEAQLCLMHSDRWNLKSIKFKIFAPM